MAHVFIQSLNTSMNVMIAEGGEICQQKRRESENEVEGINNK